ncbi:hypothetical protein ACFXPI_11150 [Streptomyces sp. NPDC059104]|uniref:hypothetical protein n=1 Tax=Streptomyces sp. NPDC059104 TaxID=3346729 RepID=UPI0036A690A2
MPWKSRLAWTADGRTVLNGRTYALETHSYWTGKGGWSGTDDWHVHEVPAGSSAPDPRPTYGPLGTNARRARRLAELRILGWTPGLAGAREPQTGRDRWYSPNGVLAALEDLLTGDEPH